jgi:5-methylcytosine-specific restriction endonuclease McrA
MLQVVRRDDHVCQLCFKYVRDDDIEFDHLIPIARGGETCVGNIRLLCRVCNGRKSDKVDDLLIE